MQNDPVWLPLEEVIEINREVVEQTGEGHALLRSELLESALIRPQNRYYYDGEDDVLRLSTTLMFAVARNHPFEQGNKRTGFIAGAMFLQLNGYELNVDGKDVADEFYSVVNDEFDEIEFANRVEKYILVLAG